MNNIFTILIIDDVKGLIIPAEKYLNSNSGKKKIIDQLNEKIQNKDKIITDLSINVFYDIDATPDIPQKYASYEAINRIHNHEDNPIDLILTDLNMKSGDKTNCIDQVDGCDGSDIIREATKFKIPIYMTSNSLADYFKIQGNNRDTFKVLTRENYKSYEIVKSFIPYCKNTNVFGILTRGSGKIGVPDIQNIINEYIEYKNNEMNEPISNVIIKKPTNKSSNEPMFSFFTNPFSKSPKAILIDDSQSDVVKKETEKHIGGKNKTNKKNN